jgi:hypothetical protein
MSEVIQVLKPQHITPILASSAYCKKCENAEEYTIGGFRMCLNCNNEYMKHRFKLGEKCARALNKCCRCLEKIDG